MNGLWVVLGAVLIGTALGVLHRVRQGRISRSAPAPEPAGAPADPGDALPPEIRTAVYGSGPADDVVLLQLSTTICAPCRHARIILADLAEHTPRVRHVEFDLTPAPEVAGRLGVMKTPTTIALDRTGRELFRVHGVPKKDTLLAELEAHLGS